MNRPVKTVQLSLRDQLALAAPPRPLNYGYNKVPTPDAELEASWRYEFADAMLKRRHNPPQEPL